MIAGLAAVALAGTIPADRVRPALVSMDTPDRYSVWRAQHGLPPDEPVCEMAWSSTALLCFRVWEGDQRRFVHASDLAAWGATAGELHDLVTKA
ncbi:MAG: hypothetical protein KC621_33880, partial [Myxococcales bacterium]|nr:hypothetical protein [Myxococcales bacterium]